METITLDARTMLIRADKENDLLEIIEFISKKGKRENVKEFLKFASDNRVVAKGYKFNRDDCYEE